MYSTEPRSKAKQERRRKSGILAIKYVVSVIGSLSEHLMLFE